MIPVTSNLPLRFWVCLFALGVMVQTGCQHIGPKTIVDDRIPYNEAIAQTWKEQTLLNLVKMRYADTITFTEVSQIISGHALDRSGGLEIGAVPGIAPGLSEGDRLRALFKLNGSVSDRPTVTYTPQTGSRFLRNLAKPLSPGIILFLIEAGYPADSVLELTVESVNGIKNRSSNRKNARPADEEFLWFKDVMRRAQLARGVSMKVNIDEKKQQTTVLILRSPGPSADPQLGEDLQHVRRVLNLDPESQEFKVVGGSIQVEKNEIAIQTRPVVKVLASLSQYVKVPAKHLADGSAQAFDLSCVTNPPMTVHCGNEAPADCFAAVPYRGCWYWIDDCDVRSKRTFIYLFMLLAQADREPNEMLPLVTIPLNKR